MKPFKASKLPIPSDLTQSAMDSANSVLVKYLMENGRRLSKFKGTLMVATDCDDLVGAIDLARCWNLYLKLQPKYEWDEWSVTYSVEDIGLELKCWERDFCVWSPGA